MTSLQKLPENVRDLGKLIVAKGFKSCPKSNKLPNLVTLVLLNNILIRWHFKVENSLRRRLFITIILFGDSSHLHNCIFKNRYSSIASSPSMEFCFFNKGHPVYGAGIWTHNLFCESHPITTRPRLLPEVHFYSISFF